MAKTNYHHGDLRASLIENGLIALAQGQEQVSLRGVARAAGVSATAVYHHFPDKHALMRALAEEGLGRLAAAQRAASAAAGGGKAGFAATGRAYVDFALANPALFQLICTGHKAALKASADEMPEAMAFLLANAKALAPKDAKPGVAEAIAVQGWAMAHGLASLMLSGQIPVDQELIALVLTPEALVDPGALPKKPRTKKKSKA